MLSSRSLELDQLQASLVGRVQSLESAVIAFSGGVDSSLVAALAGVALGTRALAVTAVSPALAMGELDGARAVASAIGIAHETVRTTEIGDPAYRRNDHFRCFYCKHELYTRLSALAQSRGYAVVLSGANADDLGDWRPGLDAAAQHGVVHPLLEAGVGKQLVRELARRLELPSAEKPASPCLASRVPYGTKVDEETLRRIDQAEEGLRRLGLRVFRVRHFGDLGRVELSDEELEAVRDEPGERAKIEQTVRDAGYASAVIAPRPFRSGSLNLEVGR